MLWDCKVDRGLSSELIVKWVAISFLLETEENTK